MQIYRWIYTTKKFYRFPRILYIFKRRISKQTSVVKSKSPKIQIPNLLINEFVWRNLEKWYNKTAVICFETGRTYTFGDIYRNSSSLASSLRNILALNMGDTVAIVLPNVAEFPIVFLGGIQANLLVTTVNPFYNPDEMVRQLKDSGSKLIFTTVEMWPTVSKAVDLLGKKLPIVITNQQEQGMPSGCLTLGELYTCDCHDQLDVVSAEDIAILPYSSGTTGLAKGVELSHQNVVANLSQMSSPDFILNLETEGNFQDVIPVFLPLFHIYGMVAIFLNFFSQGCKLVMVPQFVSTQFVKLLRKHRPTLIFAVPQIILLLNNPRIKNEDLATIRTIVSAAAPLGIAAVKKFNIKTNSTINLLQMYGMTETSPLTIMQTTALVNGAKLGGSGYLLPNTECKVVAVEDTSGVALGANDTGELLIRGPQVMKGYYNNLQATKEVLDDDGWLRTGDVGHYDEDQHFFITDRQKELIKVKGFQVAPAELEEILRNHSAVKDVAVVGVSHPVQGEAPRAFVVLKPNSSAKPQQLKEYVASKVANYKRLVGGVVITDSIPRNRAGKVLRRQLKDL